MALLVDATALLAQADADEPLHAVVSSLLREEREALVTSEFIAAEADYLILKRLGVDAELAFVDDLANGTYTVDCLTPTELRAARDVIARHRDLRLGIADASLVVLADRYSTRRILTFDQRAFRTVQPLQGGAFTILPADAT